MNKDYRSRNWKQLVKDVIEMNEGVCSRCSRSKADGAILQLHHREYMLARKPWEYELDQLELLCKGCHAVEHGIIMPTWGWVVDTENDLGGLDGECEWCGTALRHEHLLSHPSGRNITVGADCADRLTSDPLDSLIEVERRNRVARRRSFVTSVRWKRVEGGTERIKVHGQNAWLQHGEDGFRIQIVGVKGRRRWPSAMGAKSWLFDLKDSGRLADWLSKLDQRLPSNRKTDARELSLKSGTARNPGKFGDAKCNSSSPQ